MHVNPGPNNNMIHTTQPVISDDFQHFSKKFTAEIRRTNLTGDQNKCGRDRDHGIVARRLGGGL